MDPCDIPCNLVTGLQAEEWLLARLGSGLPTAGMEKKRSLRIGIRLRLLLVELAAQSWENWGALLHL